MRSKTGLRKEKSGNLKDNLKIGLNLKEIDELLDYIDKRRKLLIAIGRL